MTSSWSVDTSTGKTGDRWRRGYGRRVGFHAFRHTCATLKIIEEGWSLEQVQVFLGHASYQTTARYYAHLRSTDAPVPAPIRRVRQRAAESIGQHRGDRQATEGTAR